VPETLSGAIVVDKPSGWTSHDVVNKVRRLANTRKVGHLGTLDPIATGVLPVLVGRATRLAQFYGRAEKRYEGVVHFGYATTTYDVEGEPTSPEIATVLRRDDVEAALARFRGKIMQTPPPVSAKKIQGVPAYKLARQNVAVELEPVEVEIFSIELVDCAENEARVRVHCSAGTYVRSIAHELGGILGGGAFLKQLRRTASGAFDIASARTLEQLAALAADGRIFEAVIPAAQLLPDFPCEIVDATTTGFIRNGRDFRVSPFRSRDARFVKAITTEGELVAVGEIKLPNLYHPVLVL
jgi:tRNA pseudouridine55 synthase